MNDSDKKDFAITLGELQMKCQGELSKEKLSAYWAELKDYPLAMIQAACKQLARQRGRIFFPAVGEFFEVLEGSAETNAQEAWAQVLGTIGRGGYHANNPPQFDDPRIARALMVIGGYKQVCLTPYDEQQWLQKRFAEAYETADCSYQREEIKQISRDEAAGILKNLSQKKLTEPEDDNDD